jgi:hypothetical protein
MYNKNKPEDFGLTRTQGNDKIYLCESDRSEWVKKELYDFGWGNENGYVRMPQLGFEDLLFLLENSELQDNLYGSAYILVDEYPDKLLDYLYDLVDQENIQNNERFKRIARVLRLETSINRSKTLGKTLTEIKSDYEKWRFLSERAKSISKE